MNIIYHLSLLFIVFGIVGCVRIGPHHLKETAGIKRIDNAFGYYDGSGYEHHAVSSNTKNLMISNQLPTYSLKINNYNKEYIEQKDIKKRIEDIKNKFFNLYKGISKETVKKEFKEIGLPCLNIDKNTFECSYYLVLTIVDEKNNNLSKSYYIFNYLFYSEKDVIKQAEFVSINFCEENYKDYFYSPKSKNCNSDFNINVKNVVKNYFMSLEDE